MVLPTFSTRTPRNAPTHNFGRRGQQLVFEHLRTPHRRLLRCWSCASRHGALFGKQTEATRAGNRSSQLTGRGLHSKWPTSQWQRRTCRRSHSLVAIAYSLAHLEGKTRVMGVPSERSDEYRSAHPYEMCTLSICGNAAWDRRLSLRFTHRNRQVRRGEQVYRA